MVFMFFRCSSLSTLPDISKWDTSKVNDICGMFKECSSLSSFPDISKWNTPNDKDLTSIFEGCSSLSLLSDISKWTITFDSYIYLSPLYQAFYKCIQLSNYSF